MPSSYTCLHYHLVWSTKDRRPIITPVVRDRLYSFIGGIIRNNGGILLSAGGVPDHVHHCCSLDKKLALSDVLRDIKSNSSGWVRETFNVDFAWQTGYAAFSVSHSGLAAIRRYIAGQEEHHRKMSFKEELLALLKKHEVEYDERYVFE